MAEDGTILQAATYRDFDLNYSLNADSSFIYSNIIKKCKYEYIYSSLQYRSESAYEMETVFFVLEGGKITRILVFFQIYRGEK